MKKLLIFFFTLNLLFTTACATETPAPTEPAASPTAGESVAAQQAAPTPAPAESATPAPTDTPAPPPTPAGPFPPLVVAAVPERGAEQPLDTPIELTFDQPMDRASVEKAFAIEPGASVDGAFEWVDDQTVRFALNNGWQRGQRYRVRVVESAEGQAGLKMERPFEFNFSAQGFLSVTSVQPAANSAEVSPDALVLVMFSRPVAPLGAAAGTLPDPLTFTPPVSGRGEWLNTATYQFTPDTGFEPATQYTARIAAGLTDVSGAALLEPDFEWAFTTVSPAVAASLPTPGDMYVSQSPVISVAFNQLMNHTAVEQNLQLVDLAGGAALTGSFSWQSGGVIPPSDPNAQYDYSGEPPAEPQPVGVETVAFMPDSLLQPGGEYQLLLPKGVASKAGAPTAADYRADFSVSPLPVVVSTNPPDGEQFADMWQGVDITFNAPMNPASIALDQSLFIEPEVAATDVYTYWANSDTQLSIGFPRQPNTAYTVTLTTRAESRYGQPLGEPARIRWQTLRQSPYVYLVSPKVGVYNGYQPQTYIYMTVRNVAGVDFSLYRLPEADFRQLSPQSYRGFERGYEWDKYRPRAENLLGQWQQSVDPAAFENTVYKVDVSQALGGEPLPPGLYYLEASAPPDSFFPEAQGSDPAEATDRQILIVSKRNLSLKRGGGELLVWLTDLQTGQPVGGVPLRFDAPAAGQQTETTANDGVATFSYQLTPDTMYAENLVFTGQPDRPDENFAVASSGWGAGIQPFEFNNISGGSFTYSRAYGGVIYPERRLYRPGQTVYFKGVVRADNDARYSVPSAVPTVTVTIYDPQYRPVFSSTERLNAFGTYNGQFMLDEEASLGSYQLEAVLNDPVWQTQNVGYTSFAVAEYRKPEFLVTAATDRPEVVAGQDVTLSVQADFFAGGPVANAPVRWTLLSDDFYFDYQGQGYYNFTAEDSSRSHNYNPAYGYGFGQQLGSGEGVTDADGRFSVTVPADLTGRLNSQTFTFDVAVTGLNNQEVAAQARTIVHQSEVVVGVRSLSGVGRIGEPNEVEVLAVDWQSQPVANQKVEVLVTREDWYSVQTLDPEASQLNPDPQYYWTNLVNNIAIFTDTVTTAADGTATVSFTPDDGGSYKIYARAVDPGGRAALATTFIWASGYQYVNWGQDDHDRIELVADQPEYATGDTAKILVPHPFSGTVTALVTLERGRVHDHFVTTLQTNSDQIDIPITAEMSPNIYVSVLVLKGMDAVPAAGVTPPEESLAGFKLGYTRLTINPAEKQLNISLTPSPPADGAAHKPGESVSFQVKVTDFAGRPVQAEFSLALVDKAVLTLAPDLPNQLRDAFWQQRGLDVQTALGMTLAIDRINRALDERKGGGGGEGPGGPDSVRQNFADTALWLPDFTTAADGTGAFEATLPDNLTTWVLLAKAITGDDTLVGESQTEIVTSKPLLVRPVTPRFMVVGDAVRLGQVVQNNTAEPLTVTPSFLADGLEVKDWRIGGGDWQPIDESADATIAAGAEVKIEYNVTVLATDEAQLTFGVKTTDGRLGDAIAFGLPVYRLNTPETVATLGALAADGTRQEGVLLPPAGSFDPTVGGLTVSVEPSLAGGIQSGLNYLQHFPYECVEQTVSRFLPNIATVRAFGELGLARPELETQLKRQVTIGLQKLYSQQNFDGGWGWWPGDSSDPNLSAYALLGLVEARRAGFTVDDYVVQSAVTFLQGALVAPKDIAQPWQANQQAFMLYALAEAGQTDMSRMVTLFDRRDTLDNFGRAYLALGLHLADPAADQLDPLVSDLTNAAVASATGAHWEEAQPDPVAMNTDARSTAIVIAALSRIQPDHPLLPEAVRWLMTMRRQEGYWATTQETAWSIIGLTDWLAASGELQADYRWQVSLNGRELGSGQAEAANLDETTRLQVSVSELLAGAVNRLAFERDSAGSDAGRLYYAAYLTTAQPVNQVKALDRGLTVQRQYSLLGGDGSAITGANVGDYVQVKLTLIAPTDLHYVMVEDYLPAGVEALDSSLKTTSLLAQPPQFNRDTAGQPWGWWVFNHTDLRDEKAVLFASTLPAGVYEYTYTVRAAIPGEYRVIPTHAEEMYFPEVFGRSDGGLFEVRQ